MMKPEDRNLQEENLRLRNEIEESQEQIRKLIELKLAFQKRLQEGVVVLSKTGHLIDVSEVFCELTGLKAGDLIGRPAETLMRQLLPPDHPMLRDPEGALEQWRRTAHNLRFDLEYNGRILEIENQPPLIGDDLLVALVRDVTRERRTARESEIVQERYRKLAELSTDLIFILDRTGTIEYVNPAAAAYFGKRPEELVGRTQGALFPGPAGERHGAAIRSVFETGQIVKRDSVDEFIFGRIWLDVRLIPLSSADGRVQSVMGICRDITERKRHEEALRFSRTAMDNATEVILWTRDDGVVTYANAAAGRLLGYTTDEVQGMRFGELDPGASDALWKPLWESWKAQGNLTAEVPFRTRDGRSVVLETTFSILTNGEREFACLFARDTSDRKFAEQELLKSIRLRDEFLANMSHEIRTPMTPILGYTELLLETKLTENQRKYIETIHSSTESLLALLNNLIDLAKLEAGHFELVPDEFLLRELLQEIRQSVADKARRKKLKIVTELPAADRDLRLLSDRSCLRQVLSVLMSNAVKFTDRGAVVLSAASDASGGQITLSVRDTGIGIPAAMREVIFDKFVQADPSSTRRHGGSGLGLPIARNLVRILGGRLTVDSTEGEGSVFTLQLPLVRAREKAAQPALTEKPGRILIAEDDEATRMVLRSILLQAGFEVVAVSRAFEAVEQCRSGAPLCAVIMDLHLRDRDGCEAAVEIRTRRPDLPIVILTAAALEKERARCLKAGCAAFVTKPFRTEQLLSTLSSVLRAGSRPECRK